jgi:Zn finger protein HypA/HybF involved in hydrogenase expression
MPRKKTPRVEIVPRSEEALVPAPPTETPQAMLDRIVRERVDEIMAERGAGQLDPDFQTRKVAYEIQRRQTVFERRRWSIYFEKFGCRRCDDKEVSHCGGGYCDKCHGLLWQRLAKIKLDYEKANTERDIQKQIDHLTLRSRTAQALLGGEK